MRAIILSIGDELTLGQTLDTNSQWLSAALAERSVVVIEHRTLSDDRAALAAAIHDCVARCDLLVTTGGLGPTSDDLTREAMGDVATPGEPLHMDVDAREQIRLRFASRGRPMPEMNTKQAQRPATFECLPNPNGTAPGLIGRIGQCRILCLPGPPREMQPMFAAVADKTIPPQESVLLTARLQEFGMGESVAAEKLGELMNRDRNPLVGTTASNSIVSARIRAAGELQWSKTQLDLTTQRVREAWTPYVFAEDDSTLAEAVGRMLKDRHWKLATAESCTGGWLGKSIVDSPGSSAYYLGGWVTYSNELKTSQLDVPPDMLERHGAVSYEVAQSMARGAMLRSGADCALAITGVAGPDGGSTEKPVGTVYVALVLNDGATHVRRYEFPGERTVVRDRSVKASLQMLRFAMLGVPATPMIWESTRPA